MGGELDLTDQKLDPVASLDGHTEVVWNVAISANRKLALSGSGDHSVILWNLTNRKCISKLRGHTEGVTSVDMSSNGRWGVSGSRDRTLRVWDVRSKKCDAVLKGHED